MRTAKCNMPACRQVKQERVASIASAHARETKRAMHRKDVPNKLVKHQVNFHHNVKQSTPYRNSHCVLWAMVVLCQVCVLACVLDFRCFRTYNGPF